MGWPRRRRQQQQQLRRRASSLESVHQSTTKNDMIRAMNDQAEAVKMAIHQHPNPAMESEVFKPAKTLGESSTASKWHTVASPLKTQAGRRHGGLREKLYSVDSLAETDDEEEDDDDEEETESEEGSEDGDAYAVQLCHEPVAESKPAFQHHKVETVQEEPEAVLPPASKTLLVSEDETSTDEEDDAEVYASNDPQQPTLSSVITLEQMPAPVEFEAPSISKTLDESKVVDGEDTESEDGDDELSSSPSPASSCVPAAQVDAEVVKVDLFGQQLDEKEKQQQQHAPFLFPAPYFPGDLDEYESDIYEALLRREKLHHVVTDYFSFQPHVTGVMRAMLIDWLVEVHNHFNLQPETLFLTVNYIDRFLAKVPVKRENFQLVALTALLIASKYEEVHPVDIEDLVYICERSYTAQQIVTFEKEMLQAFKWQLVVPTSSGFLEYYIDKLSVDLQVAQLATFFSEQALLDFPLSAKYVPSVVASSALLLAQCYAAKDKPELTWVLEFEEVTGYYAKDIWCCVRELSDMLASLSFDLVAVRTKFRSSRFGRVADIPHVNVSGIVIE
ncbi:hypothetical protein Gpo141_00009498 [Globisporangium polare]